MISDYLQNKYRTIESFYKNQTLISNDRNLEDLTKGVYDDVWITGEYSKFKVREGMDVIDAGANQGYYTIKSIEEGANKVYVFEPCLETYRLLRLNTLKYEGAICMPFALSDRIGETQLYYFPSGISGSSIIFDFGVGSETVQAITIDFLYKTYDLFRNVDILKMDVEGVAHLVLKGAKNFIEEQHPRIIVAAEHSNEERESCIDILQEYSYDLIDGGKIIFVE